MLSAGCSNSNCAVYINEILFNPPGSDTPNEYIELRSRANYVLPQGTYLVGIEGDINANPGVVQNVFDLSGLIIGGNGFLVLLQKGHNYNTVFGATVITNAGADSGWGNGQGSTVGHSGEGGQTELENPSVTFMLIQAPSKPAIGDDIDSDNDGFPDGSIYNSWTILDAIGIADSTGAGDATYGFINYSANTSANIKVGRTVNINFTAGYVGRLGNSTNSTENDWVVSDNLNGAAPLWLLGPPNSTLPTGFSMAPLNNIGGPNFNAYNVPGVIVYAPGTNTVISENGGTNGYYIQLNTQPTGQLTIQLITDGQLLLSTNYETTFSSTVSLVFSNTNAVFITVKAVDDSTVESSPHKGVITHSILSTDDPLNYPLDTIIPDVVFSITDNDLVILNEIKVNPPGEDAPFEFVEIRGSPDALLTNVYFLAIDGSGDQNPGKLDLVINLSGQRLGANGILFICASNSPYSPDIMSSVFYVPGFSEPGGKLNNGCASFLLVSTAVKLTQGKDLDNSNNGILEGLPADTFIYDAIGWSTGKTNDVVYGGVVLNLARGTPDAATRFSNNTNRLDPSAWFYGALLNTGSGASIEYDESNVSTNFPSGVNMSPGKLNDTPLIISKIEPLSGVIGDPTNPSTTFTINNSSALPQNIQISVGGSNPAVTPSGSFTITRLYSYTYSLKIEPSGVGYSTITVSIFDGVRSGSRSFQYAASAMGRPNGIFLTGASDGSAAVALDDEWMLVGDDENETIRLYPRNRSGAPVASFNMTPYLGLIDFEGEQPREVDIEEAMRVGNKIYWIGAHSNANLAEGRTNRSRIFVTAISGSGSNTVLSYVGRYDHLKYDLVNWDASNGHGKGANYYGLAYSTQDGVNPKAPYGFNIEGLAIAPQGPPAAYVGLRAPIVPPTNRVFALIVPVLNFTIIAESNGDPGSAVFGEPIELDLFGRGIRSIAGNSNGYIIIAGTPLNVPGPYPDDFKIFTWSGNPQDKPQERSADLYDLVPEAIVEIPPQPWTADTVIQVVSDCGTRIWYGDGVPAKQLPVPNFKKIRVDRVAIGDVVKSAPIITSLKVETNSVRLQWRSVIGDSYKIEYKGFEQSANWVQAPEIITATETTSTYIDNFINSTGRIYRVRVLP